MEIDEQIVYGELNQKRNSIWSLLLASGYLKPLEVEFTEENGRWNYQLVLTNKEVGIMFSNMIRGWFSDSDGNYNDFIKALLKNDLKAMNAYMYRVAWPPSAILIPESVPPGKSRSFVTRCRRL